MTAKPRQESSGNSIKDGEEGLDIKALRDARGLSLDDVFQATRISLVNLVAMEKGEFHLMPPPVYARAYFKAYAKLLEVDEKQIISGYENFLATFAPVEEEEPAEPHGSGTFCSKKVIAGASLTVVLCLSVFAIYIYSGYRAPDVPQGGLISIKSKDMPAAETSYPPATVQPEANVPVKSSIEPGKKQAQVESRETISTFQAPAGGADAVKAKDREGGKPPQTPNLLSNRLIIKAQHKTWLRIGEDNKKPYQILMKPGDTIERSSPQFTLDIGNAGGITVEFQGKTLEPLGKSGEVVHLRLP